jgi:hypothetical protein
MPAQGFKGAQRGGREAQNGFGDLWHKIEFIFKTVLVYFYFYFSEPADVCGRWAIASPGSLLHRIQLAAPVPIH